jgi:hypothetical protein
MEFIIFTRKESNKTISQYEYHKPYLSLKTQKTRLLNNNSIKFSYIPNFLTC